MEEVRDELRRKITNQSNSIVRDQSFEKKQRDDREKVKIFSDIIEEYGIDIIKYLSKDVTYG